MNWCSFGVPRIVSRVRCAVPFEIVKYFRVLPLFTDIRNKTVSANSCRGLFSDFMTTYSKDDEIKSGWLKLNNINQYFHYWNGWKVKICTIFQLGIRYTKTPFVLLQINKLSNHYFRCFAPTFYNRLSNKIVFTSNVPWIMQPLVIYYFLSVHISFKIASARSWFCAIRTVGR